jgi:hypothetical protein
MSHAPPAATASSLRFRGALRIQMDRWAETFDSWEICDQRCQNLFAHTACAHSRSAVGSTARSPNSSEQAKVGADFRPRTRSSSAPHTSDLGAYADDCVSSGSCPSRTLPEASR